MPDELCTFQLRFLVAEEGDASRSGPQSPEHKSIVVRANTSEFQRCPESRAMGYRPMKDPTHSRASDFRVHHSPYFFCLLIVGAYFLTQVDGRGSSEDSVNATGKKSRDVCQVGFRGT
jgi:hypothetical protein